MCDQAYDEDLWKDRRLADPISLAHFVYYAKNSLIG